MANNLFPEIRQQYIEAYVAGNSAAIAQLFTADCVMLPPDGPIATGHSSVKDFYEGQMAQLTPSSLAINPEEEVVMGDWGYGAGIWRANATLKATGDVVELEGKYLNIMQRQPDGAWKIHRHSWNAPTQLSAMAAAQA